MTRIGAGWSKYTQDGKNYISCNINKELLPLVITDEKQLVLWEIEEDKRTAENSPHYTVNFFIPEEKKDK
jgi:hypothetical protein